MPNPEQSADATITIPFPVSRKTSRTPPKNDYDQQTPEADEQQRKRLCTRSTIQVCYICKATCAIDDIIQCKTCKRIMHYKCIGMAEQFYKFYIEQMRYPWECSICNLRNIEETKSKASHLIEQMEEIQQKYSAVTNTLKEHDEKIHLQEQQIHAIGETVATCFAATDLRFRELEEKITEKEDIMQSEICYIQGQNTQNELVVSGVPNVVGENLQKYMENICIQLKIGLPSNAITKTHRIGKNTTEPQRPQPILYKFSTQAMRNHIHDTYIEYIKSKNQMDLKSIGVAKEGRFYINPKVPKCLSAIYKRALEFKRQGLIKAVNTKISSIAINVNDEWKTIQTMRQLETIINTR